MFKLGRGGGRGNGKRPNHPAPPSRHVAAAPSRLSLPGRGRGSGAPPPEAAPAVQGRDETFSMVSRDRLDFGAIIRLAPDLVEEIRKAEARGSAVRIKFDSYANDPTGNILDVDGKEFKFTWSKDSGDLCNIYEECCSGEDGDGLLVERGSAWRKLNVQRILDESIKNQVRMMSEEAERRNRSRKAIVLDPANPSVKNQSSAAVEGSMRRMHWHNKKDSMYKKQRVEPSQVPTSSTFNATSKTASSRHTNKSRHSVPPLPSPLEKLAPDSSSLPLGSGNISKVLGTADAGNSTAVNKDVTVNLEKEINIGSDVRASSKVVGHKDFKSLQLKDLRNFLVTLLSENTKGMSLKALERAVGEMMPCSPKEIEKILKNIANYQAPGRYVLKSEREVGGNMRSRSDCESSPDPDSAQKPKAVVASSENINIGEFELQVVVCSPDADKPGALEQISEKLNEQQSSSDALLNDVKVNDSEGRAGSSSDSGSESDSESSDSGSDSGSQSRSVAGSRSASSSDSESDGSSSSKETDVEVNITTSDDEQDEMDHKKSIAAKLKSSASPGAWKYSHEPLDHNVLFGDQQADAVISPRHSPFRERNLDVAETLETAKEMHFNRSFAPSRNVEVEIMEENNESYQHKNNPRHSCDTVPFMTVRQKGIKKQQDSDRGLNKSMQKESDFVDREKSNVINDVSDHEQFHISEKTPKPKLKRPPEGINLSEKFQNVKKIKPMGYSSSRGQDSNFSDKSKLDQPTDTMKISTSNSFNRGSTLVEDLQKESSFMVPDRFNECASVPGKEITTDFQNVTKLDFEDSGRRTGDVSGRKKPSSAEQSTRLAESSDLGSKAIERLSRYRSDISTSKTMSQKDNSSVARDMHQREGRDEIPESAERFHSGPAIDSGIGDRSLFAPKKSGEQTRNQKDEFVTFNMQKSDMDRMPGTNGRGSMLKKELSDLELGEFREPTSPDFLQGIKRHLDRKGSLKTSENRVSAEDDVQADLDRKKYDFAVIQESKKSSPISENLCRNNQGLQKNVSEHSGRPLQQIVTSQSQPFWRSEEGDVDMGSHFDRHLDTIRRDESREISWKNPAGGSDMTLDGSFKSVAEHTEPKNSRNVMEHVQQKDNVRESTDRKNNGFKSIGLDGERLDTSNEKSTLWFSKYEKDEPDLKEPIRDYSQYKEYVQEFEDKYQCYLSLNEFMEKTRAEFLKIGGDFPQLAKGKDKKAYTECCTRIIDFCHQHKMRDNRVKKTFIVLHEELKVLKQRIKEFAVEYSKD